MRLLEEAALAHRPLRVERPALAEVRRAETRRIRAAWILRHVMCQWWPGYASWTAVVGMPPLAVRLEPLLDLLVRRARRARRARRSGRSRDPRTPAGRCTRRRRSTAAGRPATARPSTSRPRAASPGRSRRGSRALARSSPRTRRASPLRCAGGPRWPRRAPRASRRCRDARCASVAHLRVQAVVLGLAHLAQAARVVGAGLALAQQPRVALLAEDPRAATPARRKAFEERDPRVERVGGLGAGLGHAARSRWRPSRLRRQQVAHVPARRRVAEPTPRSTISGCASVGSRLARPCSSSARHLLEPSDGRVDELALRPQPVQEQVEDAVQGGPE